MKKFITMLLVFAVADVNAQLRAPTPAEKPVLDNATHIITDILDRFNNNDWNKEQDYYSGDIAVNASADVPMDVNNNFERQYHVPMNSNRYTVLIKPIDDKIATAMQQNDYQAILALGKQKKALSWLTVDVYINRHVADVFPAQKATNIKMDVSGVTLCYKCIADEGDNKTCTYWLLFGNWQGAANGENGLTYRFKYPHVTPHIENIAVRITGAEDRIQQLFKTVNWSELQHALTL